jgi:hypothetical protein
MSVRCQTASFFLLFVITSSSVTYERPPVCHARSSPPNYWPAAESRLKCPAWRRSTPLSLCTTGFRNADGSASQDCPSSPCYCEYDIESDPVLQCKYPQEEGGQMTEYDDNKWTTFSQLSTGTKHSFWPTQVCGAFCHCPALTLIEKWRVCRAMPNPLDEYEQGEFEAWCEDFMTSGYEGTTVATCRSNRDCPAGDVCQSTATSTSNSRTCVVDSDGDSALEEEQPCSLSRDCNGHERCVVTSLHAWSSSNISEEAFRSCRWHLGSRRPSPLRSRWGD